MAREGFRETLGAELGLGEDLGGGWREKEKNELRYQDRNGLGRGGEELG